ncbi:MAG TPA: hypothetical protein PL082_00190 [Tepidiformaceae bacterium]|nr:hypothetical protein [Tepidiformaceae bacterium]
MHDGGVNLLSAIAPTSVPVEPIEGIQGRVAFTAAVKAVRVSNEMAQEVVQLLDPNVGRHLDKRA